MRKEDMLTALSQRRSVMKSSVPIWLVNSRPGIPLLEVSLRSMDAEPQVERLADVWHLTMMPWTCFGVIVI